MSRSNASIRRNDQAAFFSHDNSLMNPHTFLARYDRSKMKKGCREIY
jgi:hypothetical protein